MIPYAKVEMAIAIELETGMHIGTGFGMAKLLDDRTMCGPHPQARYPTALPYIPGASLKGRLRAMATQLAKEIFPDHESYCLALLTDLFGNERNAGRLIFPDAHVTDEEEHVLGQAIEGSVGALVPYLALEQRSHCAMSRVRRCAKDEMLMRLEVVSAGLSMETTIRGWLPSAWAHREMALLALAIRSTTHIGGHKARGLGAVHMEPKKITIDDTNMSGVDLGDELWKEHP